MTLGLGSRASALERLSSHGPDDPLDILVVGGGITGAGIALDAASRGLAVGLVERRDFASGTSSKSSKLVHGGLRYLEQRELGLIREASTERDLLRRLAPQLVQPIPFVLPVSDRWRRAMFGVGLWAYDALATFRNLKTHRHLEADETEALIPPLPEGKVRGGYLFYDCKTDDVRLVMEVLLQARRYGSIVANYAAARDIQPSDRISAVTIEDTLGGSTFTVAARRVIVAAGVWADDVERLAQPDSTPRVRPSKGIHLVFRREVLPMGETAAFIPDAAHERFLFIIPWIDAVIVGTTDTPYTGSLDAPSVDDDDRAYCLDALNSVFGLGLTVADIAGAYAGLRPLIAGKADGTADLSRRHAVYDIAPGVLGITGGKLTTYRRMAKDAVDEVAEALGAVPKSRTKLITLGASEVDALTAAVARRARSLGIEFATANLVRCYGDRALEVLDVASQHGATQPMVPGHLAVEAEAIYCARAEMVMTLNDLLARRTRLSLTDAKAGLGPGSTGRDLLARELGWSPRERRRQEMAHRSAVEYERGSTLDVAEERSLLRRAGFGA